LSYGPNKKAGRPFRIDRLGFPRCSAYPRSPAGRSVGSINDEELIER